MASSLLVKVTAGSDALERCSQAFTVAASGVASGVPTSLWLTGEASWFALPVKAEAFELPEAAPLADLLAARAGRRHCHAVYSVRGPTQHRPRRPD